MNKKFLCSICNAENISKIGTLRKTCNYCGSLLDLSSNSEIALPENVINASQSAESFLKSLVADVNGKKASITDMWYSLLSNNAIKEEQIITFYKNLKNRIRFCIDTYNNLSDEVKYELGDFVCTQMDSIIRFRMKHKFIYLEELDEIEALINKQKYERKTRGIFKIGDIIVITKKIWRIQARRNVLLHDYVEHMSKEIIERYNAKIEPLQNEYNTVAVSAFSIRKNLKDKINSLELLKKRELEALDIKNVTKKYNKSVKRYKIEHENMLISSREDSINASFTTQQTNVANNATTVKIDYSAMPLRDIADEIINCINNLSKAITRSEVDKLKELKSALLSNSNGLNSETRLYLDSIVQSINMIFTNEQPTVMGVMINNLKSTVLSHIETFKSKLSD